MTLAEFRTRLLATARDQGWEAREEPKYMSRTFRDRDDDISPLPQSRAIGLQLGDYPVLIATLRLEDRAALGKALKALHGQMVIARSHMAVDQIINAHILLCATEAGEGDWEAVIDIAERDETVCRKLVWMPNADDIDASYRAFVDRTFLAQPWETGDQVTDAPLDHNVTLVQRVLVDCGLKPAIADRWEALAQLHESDPDTLIARLVDTMVSDR